MFGIGFGVMSSAGVSGGVSAQSLRFFNTYLTIADSASITFANKMTISYWMKAESLTVMSHVGKFVYSAGPCQFLTQFRGGETSGGDRVNFILCDSPTDAGTNYAYSDTC